ncbi:pyridoxamine 5'-phosphate oxidase family protein [uncultured Thiohalocapsa sp.]|uniref:pyridoxamine 5'-phosphate oxidase family protein n=1 Tax=uncultured Thiohalocapsa sp. TaxID=768990 RepID=UPI0025EA7485|nr:pyridoxamine 5'-phosphate oxidase family protein [uncultured Thiohalocapsa sp.]
MTDEHFYNDLDATCDQVWQRLGRGAADRRSGFHTVQLASIGLDGTPRVRTVVLRGVDRAARQLRVHTDRRSPKFAELAERPPVEVCAYDPRSKIQIRVRGRADLATAEAADAPWAATQPGSRACYRAPAAPGAPVDDPRLLDPAPAPPADAEAGREHFSVVLVTLAHIDWLYLAARGHRRACFEWHEGRWRGAWLAP